MAGPRVVDEDPWTRVWRVDQDTTAIPTELLADLVEIASLMGLPGLRHVIAWYRRHYPHPSPHARPLSLERRADDIQRWGEHLVGMVDRNPTLEGPIALALTVGRWIADAEWRFGVRGDVARSGLARRRQLREAGRRSGEARRGAEAAVARSEALGDQGKNVAVENARRRTAIAETARTLRRAHPYDRRQYSTRWLAQKIAQRLRLRENTVRRILQENQLR